MSYLLVARNQLLHRTKQIPKVKPLHRHWYRTIRRMHRRLQQRWLQSNQLDCHKLHQREYCMQFWFETMKIRGCWYLKGILGIENYSDFGPVAVLTVGVFVFNKKLNHHLWNKLSDLSLGSSVSSHSRISKESVMVSRLWKTDFDTSSRELFPQLKLITYNERWMSDKFNKLFLTS